MFANTQMPALNFTFPDVCKVATPVGPIPIPLPNLAFTTLAIPTIFNQFITAMPMHNLITMEPMSNGDEAGLTGGGGVVSNLAIGPCRHMLGSFKVFKMCMPSTKMLSPSGQNGALMNIPGLTLTPSQVKVMELT